MYQEKKDKLNVTVGTKVRYGKLEGVVSWIDNASHYCIEVSFEDEFGKPQIEYFNFFGSPKTKSPLSNALLEREYR